MHKISLWLYDRFNQRTGLKFLLLIALASFSLHALADSGNDILAGTDTSLWATLNGTGKKYIYATELILALAAYIKTKNLLALAGVVVIAVFINVVLKVAGAPS